MSSDPEVITFEARYRDDFARLNYAWIRPLFGVEPQDTEILDHPERAILTPGGQIFFVRMGARIVGTVALKSAGDDYELTKMAVKEGERGKGHSRLLLAAAESWARARHAKRIVLYTHSSLEAALKLYRSAGFVDTTSMCSGGYARCNVSMVKLMDASQ